MELDKLINQDPCSERLLAVIVDELEQMRLASRDPSEIVHLNAAVAMGKAILSINYYEPCGLVSDSLFDSECTDKLLRLNEWRVVYEKNAAQKRRDLMKFFELVVDKLEV